MTQVDKNHYNKTMGKVIPVFILFVSAISWGAQDITYSMEDLEALESIKNYKEFFNHARDIRPAQRNGYWKKIVSGMAQSWFQVLVKSSYFDEQEVELAFKVGLWPELASEDIFKERRDRFIMTFFSQCPSKEEAWRKKCAHHMAEYWSKNSNPELLAKLVPTVELMEEKENLSGRSLPFNTWDYFLPMAKTDLSEFYCGKDPYKELVWVNLIEKGTEESIHEDCWKAFRPYFLEKLVSANSLNFEKGMSILSKRNEFNGDLKDWPFFFYLLKGQWEDPSLSLKSFEKLTMLANRPEIRESILKKIEMVPFIPDDLFSENSSDNKKHEFLQRTMESFPEFFDLYSRQCLDYLEGKKKFKSGNPTLHCREIFSWLKKHRLKKIFSDQAWNRINKIEN